MNKILYSIVLSFTLCGCASTSPSKVAELQQTLGNNGTIVTKNNEVIPVAIPLRMGNDTPKPSIIITHGSGGITPIELDQAREVTKWGFNAVIVDHYTPKNIGKHTGRNVAGASAKNRGDDLKHVIEWVKLQPWHKGKIGIIGISQGASGVWYLAGLNEPIDVAVAAVMYPACAPSLASPPRNPSFPIQLHLAGADDLAIPSLCETFGNPKYQKHIYPGATHAFNLGDTLRGSVFTHRYDRAADMLSQQRLKEFMLSKL